MSNTLSQNPNMINLDRNDPSVWSYPNTSEEFDRENPATEARQEYEHSLYVDAIARDAEQVNQYETVPATNELTAYATNEGRAIDPALSEAVLAHAAASVNPAESVVAEAQAVVNNAFAADPDLLAMHRANEEQRMNREQHEAAVHQAGAYARQIEQIRDRAMLDWGA